MFTTSISEGFYSGRENQRKELLNLPLKTKKSILNDPDLTHFSVYDVSDYSSKSEFRNDIKKRFDIDVDSVKAFSGLSEESGILVVEVWSGRTSAIKASSFICNQTTLNLLNATTNENCIILLFEK